MDPIRRKWVDLLGCQSTPANELASFMEPELGIANFIAVRHPHHNQRVEMLCMLADIYFPSKDNAA